LTTDRLFFVDKRLLTMESIDEFRLASVASVSVQKSRSGETLVIHTEGDGGEFRHMAHGQAGGLAGALRDLRSRQSADAPKTVDHRVPMPSRVTAHSRGSRAPMHGV
jgi:hypothetical protein